MGQRLSRREKVEEGGDECVHEVNPSTPVTPTESDHKAEVHPRPDETPVGNGEGEGARENKEKEAEKEEVPEACLLFLLFVSPQIHQSSGWAGGAEWGGPGCWRWTIQEVFWW